MPGSGNRARWQLTLPTDPPPSSVPGKRIYSFEQHIAFWFGMALCANQSYPEQISTCTPDSDSNIVDPKVSPEHAGSAYLELQFYPPGSAPLPVVDLVRRDPLVRGDERLVLTTRTRSPGQDLNAACQAKVGGVELDNFAFVTHDGTPIGPPNPLDSTAATFTPNSDVLLMNQGDHIGVTIKDSPQGLTVRLADHTTGIAREDGRQRGERVRPDGLRAGPVDRVRGHAVHVPPDVLDVEHRDPGDLDGVPLQHRLVG